MDVTVSLDDHLAAFVDGEVAAGRYGSPGEVVHEAIRLLEHAGARDAERLRSLRAAWREGVESDGAGELDLAALKMEARARFDASRV